MVKTEGVNTNPTTDDQKWYISFSFTNELGVLMGEVKLPVDQSTASSTGWVADTNAVGALSLPEDSYTTIIKFVGGKDAVGTVWADEFILNGRAGAWAGGIWNETVGVPEGWIYWLPRGADGTISDGYANTRITDEESYYGTHSLKFDMLEGTHDGFVGTKFYALNTTLSPVPPGVEGFNDISSLHSISAGDVLRISVWIKGEDLEPDSVEAVGDQWSVAITPIFHHSLGGNEGFDELWSSDIPLVFPKAASFDWTQFYVDVTVVDDARAIDIRLHPLGRFKGTVYMDGLEVKKINVVTDVMDSFMPTDFSLSQNYPNPFNPTTIIRYALPKSSFVTLQIYDMLGREVKTLINSEQNAGIHQVNWNGDNNYGSRVSSGTYIYTIRTGGFYTAKKMVLIK
jgi:hypothetical protein